MGRIQYAIRNFIGAAGVFAAAFYVAASGISTMLVMGITSFAAGIFSFRIYNEQDGKKYGPYMLFYGIVLALVSIIFLSLKKDFWLLKYIGAFAVAFTGYFQWIKIGNLFGTTKAIRRIETLAIIGFPILITVGVILSVFTDKLALGKGLIISGAVIWIIHNIYALILMDSNAEPDLGKFKFDARKSTYNFDKHKILDEEDVSEIVHSVGRRWERKKDSLPWGATVTVYIYDQIQGNRINYTISGTLYGTETLSDNQKFEMRSALQTKLQQMQQGLIKMTNRELTKYKQLPYPSYNISVEIGYFD